MVLGDADAGLRGEAHILDIGVYVLDGVREAVMSREKVCGVNVFVLNGVAYAS